MFYNDCSPLSLKVTLTRFRLLTDMFLFLLSTNIGTLTMRHIGNFIVSMLSLLSSSSGSHKRGGQRTAGTDPFSLGRDMMTFRSAREKKGDPPSGTHARRRDDSNGKKQCKQNDEGKIHKRQDCSTATAYGGSWQHIAQELALASGCGLTGLI